MIKFDRFPIPPTSNKLYSSFRGRLIKSKDGREFDKAVDFWAYLNKRSIERQKPHLEAIINNGGYLKVTCDFIFHKNRVFTKKGTLRKLDASNRVKQVHDNLAKIIGIDDTYFVECVAIKKYCDDIKQEQVIITIEKIEMEQF